MLKTSGLPMWVTIFALIACFMGCVSGLASIFSQGMEGIDGPMSISWGGRSIGLGLAAGAAVFLKDPTAYMAAFVGGVGRDVGDLIAHVGKPDMNYGILVGILVFLIPGVLGIIAANKARNLGREVDA